MATVGQLGASAMRRVTVHYANSPTRTTGDDDLEDDSIDDGLLQFVLGQVWYLLHTLSSLSSLPPNKHNILSHDFHRLHS
jgi:hypothetical protein